MFQAVPPPIISSTKLYIQRQVLSNHYCCLQAAIWFQISCSQCSILLLLSASKQGISWEQMFCRPYKQVYLRSSTCIHTYRLGRLDHCLQAAVLVWQYLTLYVQFCAPDDGRRNRLKHVEQFIEINRSRKRCIFWLYFRDILARHGYMNVIFTEYNLS